MMELAPRDRPREKLERSGTAALGDNELLAAIVGHGSRGASALDVANRMLSRSSGLAGLARASVNELALVPGVGRALAGRVLAAIELGRRTLVGPPMPRPRFTSPLETAEFLLPQFGAFAVERFGVLLLDTRYRLIRVSLVSVGSLDASMAHPREVFREAAIANAAALVAFHNHPSGDPSPSRDDVALTHRLMAAGEIMGIDVLDHVILADARYCSMKEAGLMK
jgi:DNA repair protein RadC